MLEIIKIGNVLIFNYSIRYNLYSKSEYKFEICISEN